MGTTYLFLLFLLLRFSSVGGKIPDLSKRVIHAVNCGGPRRLGAYGILYQEDQNPQGTASDYGSRWTFVNAPAEDRKLYETERYFEGVLTYVFDIAKDGKYAIILKFSEVYFHDSGQKVFNVHINDILVKNNLDILKETGATGLAYDLVIDASINKKELTIGDEKCAIDGQLHIKFTPIIDNPKINAIAILTGTSESLPSPPAMYTEGSARRRKRQPNDDDDDEDTEEDLNPTLTIPDETQEWQGPKRDVASGPKNRNPFDDKNDNVFVYLGVTLVCLLPVVAFLMHM